MQNETAELTEAQKRLRQEDDIDLSAYLKTLSSEMPIKVTVIRAYPKAWKGHNIGGTLDSYEEPIDEETIKETYGGGTYRLRIQVPDEKGQWRYFTNRTLKIAGDPTVRGLLNEGSNGEGGQESPSIVQTTLKTMGSIAERAEERARMAEERSRGNNAPDPAIMMALESSRDEARELRRQLFEKDKRSEERMHDLYESKNTRGSSDVLLEKFIDGESGRMIALRTQHDSEIRTTRERFQAEIDRMSARADDMLRRAEDAHKREVDSLNRSHDGRIESLKLASKSTEDSLKREIAHLERELMIAKTEVTEYRTKRDKPVTEQLTEIMTIKNAFEEFGGGGKEEKEGTIERIAGHLSPLIEGVATRMATGTVAGAMPANPQSQQAASPQEQQIPINQPVQLPDGRIVVRKSDGSIVELKRKKRPMSPTGEPLPEMAEADIKVAIEFMESAVVNDTDPGQFAATARNLVPGNILKALRSMGVDAFMADVAKLEPGSPLLTVNGKNWARKVAQELLGG